MIAAAAGLLFGLIAGIGAVVVWREIVDHLTPEKTAEVCNVDSTASGFQGWCVQRRYRPEGLFTHQVAQVWIVGRQDGADIPRFSYVPLPTAAVDGRFDVKFEEDRIELTLKDGVRLFIPKGYYRLN